MLTLKQISEDTEKVIKGLEKKHFSPVPARQLRKYWSTIRFAVSRSRNSTPIKPSRTASPSRLAD